MSRSSASPGTFLFIAATQQGRRTGGVRVAPSERVLADHLRRDRLLLIRSWRLPGWMGSPQRAFPLKVMARFNEVLAKLLLRGVPLIEALEVTEEAMPASVRERVAAIRERVAAGSSFADACEKDGALDVITASVYRAAERTGDLGGAAEQLTRTSRRQLALREKSVTVMTYPLIVMSISLVVAFIMLVFVVPMIGEQILRASGDKALPWYSAWVIGLGMFLKANLVWTLVGLAAAGMLLVLVRKEVFRLLMRGLRRLPAVRGLVVAQESARFFSVMAAMTRSGVTLAESLGVAVRAISHPKMRRQLETVRARLIEGGALPTLIENASTLPLPTRRLLIAAERSGELESAFDTLASDMAEEVDRRSLRLLAVLEPAMIVVMFVVIGSLILSVMIPMISIAGGQFQ